MLQSGTELEFSRQALERLTVEELRKICKGNGVSYYEGGKRITKAKMIEKILAFMDEDIPIPEDKPVEKVELPDEAVEAYELLIAGEEAQRIERKKKYVEQAKIGTIIAFKLPDGKVISAAITKKSTNGRKFLVETKYGAIYKISFDDVLWVRINKRWPKGIYLLFKQNVKSEVKKDGEEIN